ncbi:MAG: hydrolase [Clostridiales bacterium]|jgi:8-oxo-dGTP diphosphatase|nr:hydrolase [Clostridiales bacterium]
MVYVNLLELQPMEDSKFLCAIIVARYKEKWVFVRGKGKKTWELPGGTREEGENIDTTASRELFEETGAKKFTLIPICISSVNVDEKVSLGKLFYCEIEELGELPNSEIEDIKLFNSIPKNLTYPLIHKLLFKKAEEFYYSSQIS